MVNYSLLMIIFDTIKSFELNFSKNNITQGKIKHHTSAGISAQAINLEDDLNPTASPTATTGKSTSSKTTGQPKTTPKSKGNASTITLSLFSTIFAAILLILN